MTWQALAVPLVIGLLAALAAAVASWAIRTAHRLDRLNVRYDLSWQAMDGALARRAVVARAVAIDAYGGAARRSPLGRRLAALADAAEPRPGMRVRTRKMSCRPPWRLSIRRRSRRA